MAAAAEPHRPGLAYALNRMRKEFLQKRVFERAIVLRWLQPLSHNVTSPASAYAETECEHIIAKGPCRR